jgi:hypothetical protein
MPPALATNGWMYREKTPGLLWVFVAGPTLMLIVFPIIAIEIGFVALIGLFATIALLAVVDVLAGLMSLLQLNATWPKAIRVGRDGVEVRTFLGKLRTVAWSSSTVSDARPKGFGLLRYSAPRPGFYVLTPTQYAAVKSIHSDLTAGSERLA